VSVFEYADRANRVRIERCERTRPVVSRGENGLECLAMLEAPGMPITETKMSRSRCLSGVVETVQHSVIRRLDWRMLVSLAPVVRRMEEGRRRRNTRWTSTEKGVEAKMIRFDRSFDPEQSELHSSQSVPMPRMDERRGPALHDGSTKQSR